MDFSRDDLLRLRQWDTPTICNGLETIDPQHRTSGYTTTAFVCLDTALPPVIGYARTATIRAATASTHQDPKEIRLNYYEYLSKGQTPSIAVIEDLDENPGIGAFWGEVNTNIHLGLNVAGCVTNGSMRDLTDAAPGFQLLAGSVGPSHAHVHIEDYGNAVSVHGMNVNDGDLIHMDQHGAVVVPSQAVKQLPEAIARITRKEAVILTAAKQDDFNFAKLREAMDIADHTK